MANLASARAALRPTWAFVVAIAALAVMVRVPSYVHELFDPDEAAIASQAITLREGGTLYVDAIDRKPPLPPFLYELSFTLTGSNDLRPLHLLAALGLAGTAIALGLDARRRHGVAAGWWAGLLAVGGAVAFFPVDAQSANYAHLALLPGALAVLWARRGTVTASAGAGVALGVAILCRQSWLAGVVPGLVAAWWPSPLARRSASTGEPRATVPTWPGAVARSAALVGATAATVGAAGIFVPFSDFWSWTFSSTGDYVLSEVDPGATLGRFAATVGIFVAFHLTLVAAVFFAARVRWRDRSGWRSDLDLWLWLGAGFAAVLAGFRFFGHYWLQAIPPAIVLAAPVLAGIGTTSLRRLALAGIAVPSGLAVLFAFTPSTFRELPDPDPLATYVRANTLPGDSVLIWGNFPEVHWRADRLPGGALVHSDFVTGRSGGRDASSETIDEATPGAVDALLRAVERNPPRLVLDTSVAGLRDYDAYPLRNFPRMNRFVTENYALTTKVDGVDVWTRTDGRGSDGREEAAVGPGHGGRGSTLDTTDSSSQRHAGEEAAEEPVVSAPRSAGGTAPENRTESPGSVRPERSGGASADGGSGGAGGPGGPGGAAGAAGGGAGGRGSVPFARPSDGASDLPRNPPAPASPGTAATSTAPPEAPAPPATAARPSSFRFESHRIDDALASRMSASWRPGCPVPLNDLRYLRISYWDFGGAERLGEMVVHADAIDAVEAAFRRLHELRFPIRSMRLVDDFGGDDDASMAADNTSAFNCRPVAGTSTWSQHSYGRAVDVNPLENPYVTSPGVFPPSGAQHASRTGARGQLMADSEEVRAFTDRGWGWGGSWSGSKDYQHLSANGR